MINTLKKILNYENNPKFEALETKLNTFEIFKYLSSHYNDIFVFESLDGPKELVKSSIIGFDPLYTIRCLSKSLKIYKNHEIISNIPIKDPFDLLQKYFLGNKNDNYRYVGGLVGYVSYESIQYWERINVKKNFSFPLMEFGLYEDGIIYDHERKKLDYFFYKKSRLKTIHRILNQPVKNNYKDYLHFFNIKRNIEKMEFEKRVKKVKKHLSNGDIFQAVLSKKIKFECNGNPLLIYEQLRKINPSPYMFFFRINSRVLLGSSPEMLLRITGDSTETYPIAGSRPVYDDKDKTEENRKELLNDKKEIAEHTMLVDLARNDLGKVCRFGTVITPQLMNIKQFSHIQHLVSHVKGSLDSKYSTFEAFKAVFPAGTVSGAPKIRAMEIINNMEDESRGPYAGAIGYFSLNNNCDFAITIRSLFISKNKGYQQSGAGIVIDSDPEKEYLETEDKSNAFLSSLKIFENNRREKKKNNFLFK